jgi:hypothetical protein
MSLDQRLHEIARRILDGDESRETVNALESVLLDEYPGDDRLDALLETLSLYSPGVGMPYSDARELRQCLREALVVLAQSEQRGESSENSVG